MSLIPRRRKKQSPLQKLARLYVMAKMARPAAKGGSRVVKAVNKVRRAPKPVKIAIPVVLAGAGVAARKRRSSNGEVPVKTASTTEPATEDNSPTPPASSLKAVDENPGQGTSGHLDVDAPNETAPGHDPESEGKPSAGGGS